MHASCWICLDAVEALPQQSYSASFFFNINPKRYAIVYPIPSMYGIFTYIWLIFMVDVGKYTIHGCYGYTNPIPFIPIALISRSYCATNIDGQIWIRMISRDYLLDYLSHDFVQLLY